MKKLKKIFQTKLFYFILGIFACGTVSVWAQTYFPSNDVSYDNKASGLESTDVQGAIDELYKTCTAKSAGDQIIENAQLEKDPYECRYFFTGANPNNYITFNNETAGWRIISIECDGSIKIIRNNNIVEKIWDSSDSNNWARPADLNTYLNNDYYNSLNEDAKKQIVTYDFSIGSVTNNNSDLANQVSDENSKKWNGKIALLTLSEYLRTNSESTCQVFSVNNSIYNSCKNTTWLFYSKTFWWMVTAVKGNQNNVFTIRNDGHIDFYKSYTSIDVRPTLYLSSEVKITSGNRSESNPFQIE